MYPFILLVSLAALVMGMLNAKNVFGVPAMASSFFNLGSIVAGVAVGWFLDPGFGPKAILGLAIGTLVGGGLQFAVQLPSLHRLGYVFHPDFHWRDAGVKAILRLMGPSVVAASTTQVNVLVNSVFASGLGDGPTFWLNIAFRLMQLPLGLVGVALGTVALPLLARMAAAGNMEAFRSELARSMRLGLLLTIPASIGLMMLAEPIISVLYQHHKFGAYETAKSAEALRFYAIGLCAYAALKVLVNAFYAVDKRKTPMVVSFSAVALESHFELVLYTAPGLGASWAGFLDLVYRNFEFPDSVFFDAPPSWALSSRARMVRMLAKAGGGLRRAGGDLLGRHALSCSLTGPPRPSCRNSSRSSLSSVSVLVRSLCVRRRSALPSCARLRTP